MRYLNKLSGDEYVKDIFQKAFEHAYMFTTCSKLPVGSIIVDSDNNYYYGCNSNYESPEYNCYKKNECYKAKVTGIYESREETRKFCMAIHSEVNAINSLKNSVKERDWEGVFASSTIYITRYPCFNCAKEIVNNGIKHVRYCGVQEISDEVKNLFDKNNVVYKWFPEFNFEGDSIKDYKWWTQEFSEKAYDIVKDRKFPVTIPGYNRPALPTLKNLRVNEFTDEENWPFIIIVRDSQKEMYEEATKDVRKWVTIKSFPDEVINNAGAVRRTTQKWLNGLGVRAAFQMDDDVQYFCYSKCGRKEDGYPKSKYISPKTEEYHPCRALAMWQVAMEKAMDDYNILISCGQQIAFCWREDYCIKESSMQMICGPMTQVVCFNIEGLCKEGIYHKNNSDVGHEDIDLTIRVIESGNKVCCFPWIVYGCEALGGKGGLNDTSSNEALVRRFKISQELLKKNHSDKPFVRFRVKRGLDQCCINFRAARKYLNENFDYPEFMIRSNKIDIVEDGKLWEE